MNKNTVQELSYPIVFFMGIGCIIAAVGAMIIVLAYFIFCLRAKLIELWIILLFLALTLTCENIILVKNSFVYLVFDQSSLGIYKMIGKKELFFRMDEQLFAYQVSDGHGRRYIILSHKSLNDGDMRRFCRRANGSVVLVKTKDMDDVVLLGTNVLLITKQEKLLKTIIESHVHIQNM